MTKTNDGIDVPADGPALLEAYLSAHPETEYLACQTVSWSNILIAIHYLPLERARAIAAGESNYHIINLASVLDGMGNLYTQSIDFMDYLSNADYRPDWTTLRPSATNPKQARVMCDGWYGLRGTSRSLDLEARSALRRIESSLLSMGLQIKMGPEIEFFIMDPKKEATLWPTHHNLLASALNREPVLPMIEDAIKAIEKAGISVYKFHPEYKGNWEIALSPLPAVQGVDALVHASEAIRDIANKHGMLATTHPLPMHELPMGNGLHLHVSINGPTADEQGDHFLAGLLHHMPAVWAFLLASSDSYNPKRVSAAKPGNAWSNGRQTHVHRMAPNRWEFRLPDALGNPYLQLAALLAAGLDGIEQKRQIPSKPLDVKFTWGKIWSDDELKDHGVDPLRLPQRLQETLDYLERDLKEGLGLSRMMGEKLIELYIKYKRIELKNLNNMDPAQSKRVLTYHI